MTPYHERGQEELHGLWRGILAAHGLGDIHRDGVVPGVDGSGRAGAAPDY
jgi:hypothetical protein